MDPTSTTSGPRNRMFRGHSQNRRRKGLLRATALSAVLVLAAAACDTDDLDVLTPDQEADPIVGWATCENTDEGYRIDYPEDWHTNQDDDFTDCSVFDPEPFELDNILDIPTELAIAVSVEPTTLELIQQDDSIHREILSEREETIDGRRAIRQEVEVADEGGLLQDLEATRWLVEDGFRTIVLRTYDSGPLAYGDKQQILDDMVATLDIEGEPTELPDETDEDDETAEDDETEAGEQTPAA